MITFGTLFTESIKEVEDLNEQIQLLDEMPGANMDTRAVHKHLKKQGWSLTRSSGGHDVFTHPDAKHHIPVPRHRQLKAPLVRGILKQSEVHKEEVEASHKKILDKAKTSVPRVPKSEYERKVVSYLKKKYAKEEVELTEAMSPQQQMDFDKMMKGAMSRASYNAKWKKPLKSDSKVIYGKNVKEEVELDEARVAASASARAGIAKRSAGQPKKSTLSPAEQDAKKKESDDSFARLMAHVAANKKTNEEVEQLEEGRPSQRHPLEGHEYHKKTDAELEYIAKDAHKAAEAMKGHNTDAENKYRDQASDSATVRYFRKKNGMPNWYKKKYGHVNEEVVEEGLKPGQGSKPGWMLKADPKLGAAVAANKKRYKAFTQNVGKKTEPVKEDNVINANSQNSIDGIKPPEKKKPPVDRYMTGQSTQVSGTNVVASPRESVEIQEGHMKDKVTDADFHPKITQSEPPFDGPYKKTPKNVKDKSGAIHTPMSRVRNLARQAARKNAGLKEANDNTLTSYDKDDTPAKKTLSKTAGMVKNLAKDAKVKAKTKKSDDTFQPEPELASNIVR